MKKILLVVLGATLINSAKTQVLPKHLINLNGGYSRHGSNDLNGILFGAEYIKYYKEKFSVSFNIRGTINDGQQTLIFRNNTTGAVTDNSIQYTTAGVQLGADAGISIIRNQRHEFKISLGAFGRYQSSSPPSAYAIYYPAQTNQQGILVEFVNNSLQPRETFSAGAVFQTQYNFTFKSRFMVGISPGIQTDTNGDLIPFCTLIIGRRL